MNFNCSRCGASPLVCKCPPPDLSKPPAAPVFGARGAKVGFPWEMLSAEDMQIAMKWIGSSREPDLVIDSEHSGPYLYRWHLVPRNDMGGVYFHIQTSSDPERPLHDHPWHNMSVILAGGYDEVMQDRPPHGEVVVRPLRKSQIVFRPAECAHRLILPDDIKYTMTQFTMGPKLRKWGFWIDGNWYSYEQCSRYDGNRSVFVYPPGTSAAYEEPTAGGVK